MKNLNNEALINLCIEISKCTGKLTNNKIRDFCHDNPDKVMTIINKVTGYKLYKNKKGDTIFMHIK